MITVTQALNDAFKSSIDRTLLRVEVLFSGSTYTDITEWVNDADGTMEETDEIDGGSNANTANLTLNNDDGRFSPKNTASPYYPYLTPNKPIRITLYLTDPDGPDTVKRFTGFSGNWLPKVKSREVQLACYDESVILAGIELEKELIVNEAAPTVGVSFNIVFERAAWKCGLRWDYVETYSADYSATSQKNPDGTATTITHAGYNTNRTTAVYRLGGSTGEVKMRINIIRAAAAGALLMGPICLEGKALTALSNLANVVDGKIFFDAGGALRLRSRMYVSDDGTAHEAISPSNIEDLSYDQNYKGSSTVPLINSVSVKSTPLEIPFIRTHLDGVSLFISTISVDGQEIRNIAGNSGKFYNDDEFYPYAEYPTSYDMPPLYISYPANTYLLPSSVSGINPAFKIFSSKREEPGNNLTYGTGIVVKGSPVFSSEKFTLTLQNPNNYYVKFDRLELSGVFAQPGRSILSEHKDSDSIALYGRRDAEVDNNFIPDEVAARNRAEWAILSGKDLADIFTVDLMHGMPWMELGDTESLVEDITNMQPTTRNLVIRRLNWKYSEKSYTESHVIVPPAPVMTISTTIAGVDLVANNCKRSALQDSIPYSAISGVGKQVGLNTIPAFSQLTGSSREILSPSTYTYPTTGICYYRGFAFVCYAPGGYIQRIDPINMTVLNTWKIGDGRGFGSIKTHGNIAYIVDQDGSGGDTDRIIWVDLDRLINSPATLTQGTDWDVKIVTHDIPSMSLFVRGALEIYGDKLYCHCIRTNSPWYSRLIRVDVSNTNLVTEPEISIDTGNINSVVYANELTRGDGFIWAISPSYGSDYTLASEATAGTDTMTLTGTPTWIEGDVVRFSGVYEDATVKTVNGTTVTFDRPLVYTHAAGATVSKANTQIALINESDGTLNKIINLRDGSSGCGLEWHDGYIFVSYNDRVVKYAYDGTNMLKVGEYRPVGKYSSTGTLVFDGTYIWWVRAGQIIQLNPRGCFPVAIFTTRSYLGGTGIFTGTHMICTGSKANQGNSACYVVPRIASQSI